MSDDPIDPEAMLSRLAQLDLAAAEHAHARLMASEAVKDVTELGRTYQRAARSLRQTLGVLVRLRREAEAEAARNAATLARRADVAAAAAGLPLFRRARLAGAAAQRFRHEYDPSEAEALEADLSDLIDEVWDDDFADLSLSEQTDRLMAHVADTCFEDEEDEEDEDPQPPPSGGREAAQQQIADGGSDPDDREPPPIGDSPGASCGFPPEGEAETAPPEPPPEPPDKPYIPPWELLRPGDRMPDGQGW